MMALPSAPAVSEAHAAGATAPVFLTARWVHLAMVNYEVEPRVLEDRVPSGTELDLWQGRCFVSLVGFQFLGTRVLGMPIPFHRDFEEVNLRFYVKRTVGSETRRAVVFIREIVPRRAIAWIANGLYNEKYIALPMGHRVDLLGSRSVEYTWRHRGRDFALGVRITGEPFQADLGSEEAFITEHYWGYTRQRDGSTLEYRVEHPRWKVWRGAHAKVVGDFPSLYGPELASLVAVPPSSCFVADGSPVVVRRGIRLGPT